jgi:uncharacterized membrane protein YciS (DUF1049 family)
MRVQGQINMKEYAALGLLAWYQNMIPTLLPFMILTNLIIHLNLETKILKPLYPLIGTVFQIRKELVFAICLGFVCGFPMGSKILSDLYKKGKISHNEAQYLLAFTNNIGPAYYIGFVYPVLLGDYKLCLLLCLQYGIPLLYGLLLRYTLYRKKLTKHTTLNSSVTTQNNKISGKQIIYALDDGINEGLVQIASLGGYMIVFNVLVWFPKKIFKNAALVSLFCHLNLEITGGLKETVQYIASGQLANDNVLLLVQSTLCLNGLCCLAQTMKFLKGTDLSIKKYMLHKAMLCSITIVCILIIQLQ